MTIDSLSLYSAGAANTGTSKTAGKSELGMDDFIKLMVAQMSNQDMNNPMDNTQFLTQMAQFSMIQAISDMQNTSLTSYSVGLVGKEVTVATTNIDGLSSTTENVVSFIGRQILDHWSPSNFPWLNPEVIDATLEQGGMNFLHGWENFCEDWERRNFRKR